jgi:hypothetical protein
MHPPHQVVDAEDVVTKEVKHGVSEVGACWKVGELGLEEVLKDASTGSRTTKPWKPGRWT